jgi:hypothetical protein
MNSPAAIGSKLAVIGLLIVSALGFAVLDSRPAHATIVYLDATLDGAQAMSTCPGGSAGTGVGEFTYDDVTNQLQYWISFGGMSGAPTVAHFHGPAGPGMDAGIEFGIPDLTSPSTGTATLTATQETHLLSGLMYVNYHTAMCTGGEIRGQVVLGVGGSAGQPELDGAPLGASDSSGDGASALFVAIAAGSAAAFVVATGATLAWRRRAR